MIVSMCRMRLLFFRGSSVFVDSQRMEESSHSIPENYTVSIPITSQRGDSKFWSLMENELEPDSHVFNCILDCLSV